MNAAKNRDHALATGDAQKEDESVSPTILLALKDSKLRTLVFQLEDSLVNFLKQSSLKMSSPRLNSRQRSILYCLSRRFQVKAWNEDHFKNKKSTDGAEKIEKSVVVLEKTDKSCMPSFLFIDRYGKKASKGKKKILVKNRGPSQRTDSASMLSGENYSKGDGKRVDADDQPVKEEKRRVEYEKTRRRIFDHGMEKEVTTAYREKGPQPRFRDVRDDVVDPEFSRGQHYNMYAHPSATMPHQQMHMFPAGMANYVAWQQQQAIMANQGIQGAYPVPHAQPSFIPPHVPVMMPMHPVYGGVPVPPPHLNPLPYSVQQPHYPHPFQQNPPFMEVQPQEE
jgi:hypothetical protein